MDLLAAMRVFVRVVERGSMSEAARDLGMGQPAVSERIDRLERKLGIRLLHRSSRAMSCTDEGLDFYSRSKLILASVEEACSIASTAPHNESLKGNIRIASPQCFGEMVLPQVISKIQKNHPDLRIDAVLNDRVVDPVTEGVDISFRLGSTLSENTIARRLGYIHRVLVASPRYIEKNGMIDDPATLINHPFIHVKGLFGNGYITLEDRFDESLQFAISSAVTTSHWRPMYELILAGSGIGVVQEPGCAKALADGDLVRITKDFDVPKFRLTALMPASRPVLPKVRSVISMMKQYLPGVVGYSQDLLDKSNFL